MVTGGSEPPSGLGRDVIDKLQQIALAAQRKKQRLKRFVLVPRTVSMLALD